MSWINIDADHGMTIARVMLDSGYQSLDAFQRLRALGGSGGLGAAAGEVQAVASDSAAVMESAVNAYVTEGIDMLTRLKALLQEQAAASVVGSVVSPAAVIMGGTVVGGYQQVSAKSWAQPAEGFEHRAIFGETYQVVPNPRANELLGGGTAVTGVPAATSVPAGNLPARMSMDEYNKHFNDQLVTLAMPPMWAAKVFSNAVSIGAGALSVF